ncbi:MAG: hypothetical protein A2V90_05700 [Gammaproteobacteria bacterium RBG_16_57_12]|nr:MAG: hypothetical protein A2V90_05700 [Gammaproteobacteria bacterium RBG_16_57_12]
MHIIASNYSNNSLALIQWAAEHSLRDVSVCHIDTGWSGKGWDNHVSRAAAYVASKDFKVVPLKPRAGFEDLMLIKHGFPNQKHQWCGLHLKGITLLQWLDDIDPAAKAILLFDKCLGGSDTAIPEFIERSEYHGERKVWHPLYRHNIMERDTLLARAGFTPLTHRSRECHPCINSTVMDLRHLSERDIAKTEELEEELGAYMFPPECCGEARGIRAVVKWAREAARPDALQLKFGCSADFGCGS